MKRSNCYFFEHFIRQVFESLFGQKITGGLGGGAPQKNLNEGGFGGRSPPKTRFSLWPTFVSLGHKSEPYSDLIFSKKISAL